MTERLFRGSHNGLANLDIAIARLVGRDSIFMSLKKECLHLVGRCFDDPPLSEIEVCRWLELDRLLSNRIAIITGSRSTPAILPSKSNPN